MTTMIVSLQPQRHGAWRNAYNKSVGEATAIAEINVTKSGKTASATIRAFASVDPGVKVKPSVEGGIGTVKGGVEIEYQAGGASVDVQRSASWECKCKDE